MAPWVTVCHLGRWSSSVWWPCGFLSPATGLHQPPPPLSTLTPIRLLLFAVIEYILKCIFTLWTAFCISRLVSSGSKTKDNLGFPEMKPAFIAFFFSTTVEHKTQLNVTALMLYHGQKHKIISEVMAPSSVWYR